MDLHSDDARASSSANGARDLAGASRGAAFIALVLLAISIGVRLLEDAPW